VTEGNDRTLSNFCQRQKVRRVTDLRSWSRDEEVMHKWIGRVSEAKLVRGTYA